MAEEDEAYLLRAVARFLWARKSRAGCSSTAERACLAESESDSQKSIYISSSKFVFE